MFDKRLIISSLFLLTMLESSHLVNAQSADDVLRYSLQYPSYDPVSIVMPGVSNPTGFGAYTENPASMALFDKGFFSFGLSSRSVTEESNFLNNPTSFNDKETNVGDVGLLYKVPTARGSLVIGGGYSQTTDFNRALSISGRNNQSTLTDYYNSIPDDSLFFAAFDAYALDYATTDSSYDNTASVFRVGLPDYLGIDQDMELTERGITGEYSAFFATELKKGLMVGVSIGYLSGYYRYRRTFLETDSQDDYNYQFIDSDGDGIGDTDIDHIESQDRINADFGAFSARLGFVYQVNPYVNLGASYQFKNKLSVDETFNTNITSTFDNGGQFSDEAPGRFSYKITRPGRLNLGATLENLNGFKISAAAEVVRYSKGRIDFKDITDNSDEEAINSSIESLLKDVVNWRAGIEYDGYEAFIPRLGYGYYPSPRKGFNDASRQFFSGGFTAHLFETVSFNLGIQYSLWNDQNQLYSYDNGNQEIGEVANEDVSRWNVMGGIRIDL